MVPVIGSTGSPNLSQDVFKELQLSDRNSKVHLLSVNPLKTSSPQSPRNGSTNSRDGSAASQQNLIQEVTPENSPRNGKEMSQRRSSNSLNGSENSNEDSNAPFLSLQDLSSLAKNREHSKKEEQSNVQSFPFGLNFPSQPVINSAQSQPRKIELLSPEQNASELETHRVSFADEESQFFDEEASEKLQAMQDGAIYATPQKKQPPKIPERPPDLTSSLNLGQGEAGTRSGHLKEERQSEVFQLEELIKEQVTYLLIDFRNKRFQKLIYLYLFTGCFMKISPRSSE